MIARYAVLHSSFHSQGLGEISGRKIYSTHRLERAAAKVVRRLNRAHVQGCQCGGYSLVEIDGGRIVDHVDVHSVGPADCSDRYSAGYGVGS